VEQLTMPRQKRSGTRRSSGFSLLEVVIAMAVLSFGLLTLAMMQLHALTQGAAGRHTGDAAAVARSYLEQVHRLPWSELTAAVTAGGWQDPGWNGANPTVTTSVTEPGGATTTEETYSVQWRVTDVAGNACLRDVEIEVTWPEEHMSQPKRTVLATRRYNWGGSSC
jgi:prepilin-type N-terminal cleavage/methylation domain-containing protein